MLLLYKLKLWNAFDFLQTRGKGYQISDGDGVFYSSSVYDNYPQIRLRAGTVDLFAIGETRASNWFHPLLTSGTVLLVAVSKKQSSAH
jgi:hypothetical protein